MRILWHIIHGENRFSELKKALSGISEKVLYTSLRELEEMVRAAHSFAEKYVRKNEIRQCGDLQKSKVLQEKEKLCIVDTE